MSPRIIEPGKRSGQPCIRGLRITVWDVLNWLAAGMTERQILDDAVRGIYSSRVPIT